MAASRRCIISLSALLVFTLWGCGGVRFSQKAPEAKDFRPRSIALLSLDMGGHEEVRETLDRVITGELTDRKRFDRVLSFQAIQIMLSQNEAFRKATTDYLGKLKAVNFSDSALSRKMGEYAGVEAFLLVNVDYWYYTRESDKNLAKVSLGMRLLDPKTGVEMWKAAHHRTADYVFLKPELSSVAGDVVRQMIGDMPH